MEKCERCGCEVDGQQHSCPYASDIHDDCKTQCNCCPSCEHECGMDI